MSFPWKLLFPLPLSLYLVCIYWYHEQGKMESYRLVKLEYCPKISDCPFPWCCFNQLVSQKFDQNNQSKMATYSLLDQVAQEGHSQLKPFKWLRSWIACHHVHCRTKNSSTGRSGLTYAQPFTQVLSKDIMWKNKNKNP